MDIPQMPRSGNKLTANNRRRRFGIAFFLAAALAGCNAREAAEAPDPIKNRQPAGAESVFRWVAPAGGERICRGRPFILRWVGGEESSAVQFSLIDVKSFTVVPGAPDGVLNNVGAARWNVEASIAPGDYQMFIINPERTNWRYSETFAVADCPSDCDGAISCKQPDEENGGRIVCAFAAEMVAGTANEVVQASLVLPAIGAFTDINMDFCRDGRRVFDMSTYGVKFVRGENDARLVITTRDEMNAGGDHDHAVSGKVYLIPDR